MPELPEVETVARGVDTRLRGDWIEAAWFSEKKEPFKSPARTMAEVLAGKRIERVFRVGKHIVFDLAAEGPAPEADPERKKKASGIASHSLTQWQPRRQTTRQTTRQTGRQARIPPEAEPGAGSAVQWIVHLGMTGRLLVADPETLVPRHTHAILRMASGRELRFVDPRRFGRLSLHLAENAAGGGFKGSGREPLTIAPQEFAAVFRSRRTSIKAALLNQSLLQGVGNIYADESLFRAGIRPRRLAARLSREEMGRLCQSIKEVLREAISLGGSSVSDYVGADGERGFFQLEHKVYLRTGQPCQVCGTPIRRITVAGRGTHYCPHCQK